MHQARLFCSRAGSWQAHSPIFGNAVLFIAKLKQATLKRMKAQTAAQKPIAGLPFGSGLTFIPRLRPLLTGNH
jgi:hypothetical protein